jgi:hypothetical protein
MVGKLFVTATGKHNQTNPLSFLTDEIVDSPRRAGRTRALTLIRGSDFRPVARERQEPAQQVPNNWRTTGRSTSGNKRNVRRLMLSRQSVRASRWSAHHRARAVILE